MDSSVERKAKMMQLMDNLGLEHTRIAGIPCSTIIEGCSKSQLQILKKFKPPFIILEDDCGVVPSTLDMEIDQKIQMDCLYLGISQWAMHGSNYKLSRLSGPTECKPTTCQSVMRIYRMLSTHAILYLSQNYIDSVVEEITKYQEMNWHCDVACAEIQENYKVYGLNPPLFFQDEPKHRHLTQFQVFFDKT